MREHYSEGLGVSAITASELFYGIARSGSARNADVLRRFLAGLDVVAFDTSAAELAGQGRSCSQVKAHRWGPYDSLIAARAQALGVTLVTDNTREFERVPGLRLANWAA